MSSQPSFFTSLFDFSFGRFVTLRLVKFLYVISVILMVFVMIAVILAGFTEAVSGVETVGYIVLGPLVWKLAQGPSLASAGPRVEPRHALPQRV